MTNTYLTRKGLVRDPDDSRDLLFSKIRDEMKSMGANDTTADYDIDDSAIPIYDQEDEGSCASNTAIGDLEILQSLENRVKGVPQTPAVRLSRQFQYWAARTLAGTQLMDAGSTCRANYKALNVTGTCSELSFPYNPAMMLVSPGLAAYKEASNNLLVAYYSIVDFDAQFCTDVETAIRADHPVTIGTDVIAALDNYDGNPNTVFDPPSIYDTTAQGHALLIVGVRRVSSVRRWKIRNSWSKAWGINGYCFFSDAYLMSSLTTDSWVGTQMPQFRKAA